MSFGPVGQAEFLERMGISARAERLSAAHPERREEIATAVKRLTGRDQMGNLFKAIALSTPEWPQPAGFTG